jgi:hypothetical protein
MDACGVYHEHGVCLPSVLVLRQELGGQFLVQSLPGLLVVSLPPLNRVLLTREVVSGEADDVTDDAEALTSF